MSKWVGIAPVDCVLRIIYLACLLLAIRDQQLKISRYAVPWLVQHILALTCGQTRPFAISNICTNSSHCFLLLKHCLSLNTIDICLIVCFLFVSFCSILTGCYDGNVRVWNHNGRVVCVGGVLGYGWGGGIYGPCKRSSMVASSIAARVPFSFFRKYLGNTVWPLFICRISAPSPSASMFQLAI